MVCAGTGCVASGCHNVSTELEDEIKAVGLEKEVKIVHTGCFGLCALGPILIIYPEGSFYAQVKAEDCKEIVDEHLLKGRIVKRLLFHETIDDDDSASLSSLNETGF